MHPSRRDVLRNVLASSGGLALPICYSASTLAQGLLPTPQCYDGAEPTYRETEGPYFKPGSPLRADLVESATSSQIIELAGEVLTRSCRPITRALVDLWHADERGAYDNAGPRYRGHVFTDQNGRYPFRTIMPAIYP